MVMAAHGPHAPSAFLAFLAPFFGGSLTLAKLLVLGFVFFYFGLVGLMFLFMLFWVFDGPLWSLVDLFWPYGVSYRVQVVDAFITSLFRS